jgi:hypothetical protein
VAGEHILLQILTSWKSFPAAPRLCCGHVEPLQENTMKRTFTLASALLAGSAFLASSAGASDTLVGALIGGGAGAIVGNAVGGRDGAIVGGALGAVTGAAIGSQRETRPVAYPASRVAYAEPGLAYVKPRVVYPAPQVVYAERPVVYAVEPRPVRYVERVIVTERPAYRVARERSWDHRADVPREAYRDGHWQRWDERRVERIRVRGHERYDD